VCKVARAAVPKRRGEACHTEGVLTGLVREKLAVLLAVVGHEILSPGLEFSHETRITIKNSWTQI
jgi:hypothetical protein